MEVAARTPLVRLRTLTPWYRGPQIGAWTLGAAPVAYLALAGGGYDPIVRGQVGIAAWWIVLVALLAGIVSTAGLDRWAWGALGLLVAFVVWVALASGWSESPERSVAELGRVSSYLAFFVLGVLTVRRATLTALINGIACALGLVGLLAVLSRLHPVWFPADQVHQFFGGSAERLNYPLNYANGTGNLLAIGLPLLLGVATRARTLAGAALAAAALPMIVLAIALTVSRGAVLTGIVGLVVFFALTADRLPKLLTAAIAGAGAAVLVGGLLGRSALRDGLATPAAAGQARELAVIGALVCAAVALLAVAAALATRYAERPAWLQVSRGRARRLLALATAVLVVGGVAAGLPGAMATQWHDFKRTDLVGAAAANPFGRLTTVSGSRRYQYWQAALDAYASKPWIGRGPGTFEYWWARNGSISEYIRNAHSLYLETLAETGIVGACPARRLPPRPARCRRRPRSPGTAPPARRTRHRDVGVRRVLRGCRIRLGLADRGDPGARAAARSRDDRRTEPCRPGGLPTRTAHEDRGPGVDRRDRGRRDDRRRDPLRRNLRDPHEPGRCPRRRFPGRAGGRRDRPTPGALRGDPASPASPAARADRRLRRRGPGGGAGHRTRADELAPLAGALACRERAVRRRRCPRRLPAGPRAEPPIAAVRRMNRADHTREVERLLIDQRPLPGPRLREDLRGSLLGAARREARPDHLRALVAGCGLSGVVLLGIAAVLA